MANALANGGTHERVDRFANEMVKLMRKQLVIRGDFSRDYEGSPTAGSVKVPVRNTDVEIGEYNILTGKALTQSATTYLPILITKDYAINELLDRIRGTSSSR